jgi:hypothetical protein
MSALGQKQTCAPQKVMSALPPKWTFSSQPISNIEKLFDRLVDAIEKFVTGDVG